MELPEAGLIARVLENDDRLAFRQLVLQHQSAVRVFLRRILIDPALADDCAQEVWLTVYQKLAGFQGGSFRSWVFTIATRKALRLRSKERRIEILAVDVPAPTLPEGLKLDLEKAFLHLSTGEKVCLHLAAYEEMSHEEISQILGLPLGTVKSHLNRGKDKLRNLLEPQVKAMEAPHARR